MTGPDATFEPYAPMSWRLSAYVRRLCDLRGEPFDPAMSRGQARELVFRLGAVVWRVGDGA